MIEFIPERLPPPLEAKLRQWLAKPEADILRRVASAKCQMHQADALAKALIAKEGEQSIAAMLLADDMRQAARYHDFITILNLFSEQPPEVHFQLAKLKPATTSHANTNIADGTED